MKQDICNGMKSVNENIDFIFQLFVILNNVGIKINVDVNVNS